MLRKVTCVCVVLLAAGRAVGQTPVPLVEMCNPTEMPSICRPLRGYDRDAFGACAMPTVLVRPIQGRGVQDRRYPVAASACGGLAGRSPFSHPRNGQHRRRPEKWVHAMFVAQETERESVV